MSNSASPTASADVTCFSVAASPDPGLMPRVLELFAKRGLIPSRFIGMLEATPEPRLELDIQAQNLSPEVAAHMARSMGQIFGVEQVLLAERTAGAN